MNIEVIEDPTTLERLKRLAEAGFGDMVKAVVDVEREIMAVGGELHSDEEAAPQHPELAAGRWCSLSLLEQLANTGSEVERALNWADKGNGDYSGRALDRALELLGLTIGDPKNRLRLRELTRVREVLLDYFLGQNEYGSSSASWRSYFRAYGMAVALQRQVRLVS